MAKIQAKFRYLSAIDVLDRGLSEEKIDVILILGRADEVRSCKMQPFQ